MTRAKLLRRSDHVPRVVGANVGEAYALPPPADEVDLSNRFPSVWNQLISNSCATFAYTAALWAAVGLSGKRPSHRVLYGDARVLEFRRKGEKLVDRGTTTADVLDALTQKNGGITPWDPDDEDPARVNDLVAWDEAIARQQVPARALVPMADGDTETMRRWLAAGFGIPFGMFVGPAFDKYHTGVWHGEPTKNVGGGHELVAIGYSAQARAFLVRNSWGYGWGILGHAWIAEETMRREAFDPVAVCGGVVL